MSRDEYLQLVQGSDVFKKLAPVMQNLIMKAEGKTMEAYARMFALNAKLNEQNKNEFVEKCKKVYEDFSAGMKDFTAKGRKVAEEGTKMNDEMACEALLEQMEQIKQK